MIKSAIRSCSSPPFLVEAKAKAKAGNGNCSMIIVPPITASRRIAKPTTCSSSSYIPKLEPFSRSKLDRVLKDPPLIQKCEDELSDYCSTLDGDDSYSCWKAYFELKDMQREAPKEDVERLILQTGGVKSLIGLLHGVSSMQNKKEKRFGLGLSGLSKTLVDNKDDERHCPVPDGLPKTLEEIAEEETARMPDSSFTRLLRCKGRFPAWYSPTPDHETD